jgi:hypothetical protein
MEAADFSRMLVPIYQTTQHHILGKHNLFSLNFISQTGWPCPIKYTSSRMKGKMMSHTDAGMGISNKNNPGPQQLHWHLKAGNKR